MSPVKQAWAGAANKRDEVWHSKREAILREAARLFASEGYAGTSLAAIADGLNVSKPTLYYYIKSKEEILNACVDAGLESVAANMEHAHAQGENAYEKLGIFFELHLNFLLDDYGVLLASAVRDLSRVARKQLRSVNAGIIALIEEGITDGSIKDCDARLACFALFGAFNAIPTWFNDNGKSTRQDVSRAYLSLFLEGLGKPPEHHL